jgi:predicted Zn-ribbon and HTH transcriptional regulator
MDCVTEQDTEKRKAERSVRYLAPNHCRECGYDLTGNQSGKCPEAERQWRRLHKKG